MPLSEITKPNSSYCTLRAGNLFQAGVWLHSSGEDSHIEGTANLLAREDIFSFEDHVFGNRILGYVNDFPFGKQDLLVVPDPVVEEFEASVSSQVDIEYVGLRIRIIVTQVGCLFQRSQTAY